jgi:NAD(P)-dependent dehydrogenase (short-subunit alcohol dehydrogenase family)
MKGEYALILGSSSGFGKAVSLYLAEKGLNILGVHLDRRSTMLKVEKLVKEIESKGVFVKFFNINAADHEKRKSVIEDIDLLLKKERKFVRVFLHSLAFGTLRPYIGEGGLKPEQMTMTLEVMANSLVWWVKDLFEKGLLKEGSRIFAMTSAGSHKVWKTYGAVSAAKAALESHIRQLALELAPYKITCNAIQAGVTDTPALRKIPGHEEMIENAKKVNPSGRLTEPIDVAKAIYALSLPETYWITGNVIRVDGGEDITG